ncbi:MAG: hypothetical protein ACW991_10775 [Candidatus Hodarchaeales archaeon]
MTEKILCGECKFLLYFGEIISRRLYMRNLPSEETVLQLYKNTCPRCGQAMSRETVQIEIKE